MDFLQLAKDRYSVREYKEDKVEQEKIDKILEAGRVAPSACNNQPEKIFVVLSDEKREALKEVCKRTFNAPVVFLVGYDKNRDWKNPLMPGHCSGETDASIVCTHMMLAACSLGLGSVWVGVFNSDEVIAKLGLPEDVVITAILPVGYAADGSEPAPMHSKIRPAEETVAYL